MNITRRFFLGGVLAVAAGQIIKPSFALPTIYANGLDDDTAGLNAFFGGQPFRADRADLLVGEGGITGANLFITDTIRWTRSGLCMRGCSIKLDRPEGKPWIYIDQDVQGAMLDNVIFNWPVLVSGWLA